MLQNNITFLIQESRFFGLLWLFTKSKSV